MYYVTAICASIVCVLVFVAYLLKKHEKLGKLANETKLWEKHNEYLEIMRKEGANVDNMSDDDIVNIVRKNSRP